MCRPLQIPVPEFNRAKQGSLSDPLSFLAVLQSSHVFHETYMAGQDEPGLLRVPGAGVGDSAVSLEVLGGFSAASALARRKLIADGVAGNHMHWHFDFTIKMCFMKAGGRKACRVST